MTTTATMTTTGAVSAPPEPHSFPLGESLPPGDIHAVSVSLPTWDNIVRYMAADKNIHDNLQSDYPRFYQHASVQKLNDAVLHRVGAPETYRCAIFPSNDGMRRCSQYLRQKARPDGSEKLPIQEVSFRLAQSSSATQENDSWARFSAVLYPEQFTESAAEVWGWMGDGISSRHADFCFERFRFMESPPLSVNDDSSSSSFSLQTHATCDEVDTVLSTAPWGHSDTDTKDKIKGLIAKWVTSQQPGQGAVRPHEDVFLYPKGMCAIGDIARKLVPTTSHSSEVVIFGWPYGSTPKNVQASGYERFTFYSQGTSEELDQLESSLQAGHRIASFFCEIPSNPLCATPDLCRIRRLADKYHFAVICDDTIGTFINVDVLPYADVIITSLTKLFSGGCNVMGGSVVLNASSPFYSMLHSALTRTHEDLMFPLDAQVLLHNCVDFPDRVQKANRNALAVVNLLQSQPSSLISRVNYPTTVPSASLYEQYRRSPDGGYGSLISVVFLDPDVAVSFYNAVDLCKGPSFGANFTLVLPYSQLAHAFELDWAESQGMPKHIVRISVGLEDETMLIKKLEQALIKCRPSN
uniref:Cystathionine gamma-synthase n=1 Tax=Coccidioides posadasii RMSCC 3488 TaxID=454284 RepID=A0A0J6IKK6_COCPO|nr:cystathionine gamma-synthase [Coccidioides posadasii RMSCC 3488]